MEKTTESAVSRKLGTLGFEREDIHTQTGFYVEANEIGVLVVNLAVNGKSAASELRNNGYLVKGYYNGDGNFYSSNYESFYVIGKGEWC